MTTLDDKCITVREYVDVIVTAIEKRYDAQFKAQEKALELALAAKTSHTGTIVGVFAAVLSLFGILAAMWKH